MGADGHGLVHLVGSFPTSSRLATAREVFEIAGPALGGFAGRLPDGEPQGWINFSNFAFGKATGIERVAGMEPELTPPWAKSEDLKRALLDPNTIRKAMGPAYRIAPGLRPDQVEFAPTGYVELATESYKLFVAAREKGTIAAGTKFQQSMPTPNIMISSFVPADAEALRLRFEQHLFAEVEAICAAIPHGDLAFQWDVVEVGSLEAGLQGGVNDHARLVTGGHAAQTGAVEPDRLKRHAEMISRACNAVPADVALGVHLCYGNAGGRHTIEPSDTSVMVAYANAFIPRLNRPLSWLHMPVPIARDDEAYFAPLNGLRLPEETTLFLGLVHPSDGAEGAKRRIAAAKTFLPRFGVGTECGLRFFDDRDLPAILELHRDAARLADQGA